MKYEDISKNGYPLGFLIKKAESNTNGLNKTFTLTQGKWIYYKRIYWL